MADAITVPLDDALDRATIRTARIERIDREARRVHLADGTLDYDYAAVCLGAETAFHDLPGVVDHAVPLKRLAHARRVRESFLDTCETGGRAVVGGAGLSGVQVAGELAALAAERAADVEVTVLERLDSVAPSFPDRFQTAVHEALEDADVAVHTGARVTGATESVVRVDGQEIPYDTFVWTGGIRGPDALNGDRPAVRGDLRLDAHTVAIGDAARVVDADGEAVPASAAAAIREARVAARNLDRLVRHERAGDGEFTPRLDPFRFEAPGWIVSIGDDAVATVGPTVVRGAPARAMKASVGAGHLSSVGAIGRAVDLVGEELG